MSGLGVLFFCPTLTARERTVARADTCADACPETEVLKWPLRETRRVLLIIARFFLDSKAGI
jgi:hypothetical protein